MDVTTFWNDVHFTPLYKERNLWIMGATVDSGQLVQLRVVSKNKANKLSDMNWLYIFGTEPREKEKTQYFGNFMNIEKVLILQGETRFKRIYHHKSENYTIEIDLNPNIINMYIPDDKCTLNELISKPTFTIKKIDK